MKMRIVLTLRIYFFYSFFFQKINKLCVDQFNAFGKIIILSFLFDRKFKMIKDGQQFNDHTFTGILRKKCLVSLYSFLIVFKFCLKSLQVMNELFDFFFLGILLDLLFCFLSVYSFFFFMHTFTNFC